MTEKYPSLSLLPETYAKVMEVTTKLNKNFKTVNDSILLRVKPRTEILTVNGMNKKPAKQQAAILYESGKALSDSVVQARCREATKIKESIRENFTGKRGREGKHWDARWFCAETDRF